jgi:hypothetical protein
MSETERKPIRLVSWEDVFIDIVLAWMGAKILDILWQKFKKRIKVVGETHLGRYLFVMFGETFLLFLVGWLIGVPSETKRITKPENMTESEFDDLLQRLLMLHKRYHEFVGKRPCRVCLIIFFYRDDLENRISTRSGRVSPQSPSFSI